LAKWPEDADVEMMFVPELRASGRGEPALLFKGTNQCSTERSNPNRIQ